MADPISTSVAITGALAIGRKVLGPTIDQFATDLKEVYTVWRANNFQSILRRVDRRTTGDTDPDPIHPRVARAILEDGSWIDDDVQQEYLAGLLLSSRVPDGKDDTGAYYATIAARLTSAQVRLHHLIYSTLENTVVAWSKDTPRLQHGANLTVVTGWADFSAAFGDFGQLPVAVLGLAREGLIRDYETSSPTEEFPEGLARFQPNATGALLYSYARGLATTSPDAFRKVGTPLNAFEPEPRRLAHARIGEWDPMFKALKGEVQNS